MLIDNSARFKECKNFCNLKQICFTADVYSFKITYFKVKLYFKVLKLYKFEYHE